MMRYPGKKQKQTAANIPTHNTHNWPYDFCSIVELAKLDSEVQLGGELGETSAVSYIPEPTLSLTGQIASNGPGTPAATDTSNLQGPSTSIGGASTNTGMSAAPTGDY